jgi:hypothetical protein
MYRNPASVICSHNDTITATRAVSFETTRGSTPLVEAAKHNHSHLVDMLIQRGAMIHQRTKHRLTAADWAIRSGYRHVHLTVVAMVYLLLWQGFWLRFSLVKVLMPGEQYRIGIARMAMFVVFDLIVSCPSGRV